MIDAAAFIEQAPVQDQDLLLRLNLYFDVLDQRLRHGQGWFIFNAGGSRLNRIAGFIQAKLASDHAGVSSYLMPWRDFALSAYVNEVGLSEIGPGKDGQFRSEHHRIRHCLRARMVVEENISALNVFILEYRLQTHDVRLQLFAGVEIVVPLVAMLMMPPFLETSSVQS